MPSSKRNPGRAGFTLLELIVTIGVIGVLTAIAIPLYSGIHEASEKTVAEDHVELLNRAVTNFSQACWKLPTAADPSSTADEITVIRSLQYQFPSTNLIPGSPFFDPRYDPPASSDSKYLRIRWNGKSFELLQRGVAGTGLRFNSGADNKSTNYSFPNGYKPAGAP